MLPALRRAPHLEGTTLRSFRPILTALFVSWACACAPGPAREARAQTPADTLDLDTCIRTALERQPSLRSAQASAAAAHARSGQALSAALPQLSVDAALTRSGSPGLSVPGEVDATNYSSAFSLRQRVLDFGVTLGSIGSARASAQAADQTARATRLDVIQGVESAYYGLLKTHRLVEVAEQARAQQELHYKQAQAFFSVGTHPRIDVTTAEANLTSAELDLIKARNNDRIAAVALASALGLDVEQTPPIRDIHDSRVDSVDSKTSLAEAERSRPELLAAEARVRAARAAHTSARGDLLPTLDATISYGWRGSEFPLDRAWSAGLSAGMPIFDGLFTVRRVQEASANLQAAEFDYADLRLKARQDVESAVLNLNVARDNLRVADQLLAEAQENFDVAEGRYRAGTGSIIEVTDAQVLLTTSRTQDVQARYDLQIARSTWLRALGRDR